MRTFLVSAALVSTAATASAQIQFPSTLFGASTQLPKNIEFLVDSVVPRRMVVGDVENDLDPDVLALTDSGAFLYLQGPPSGGQPTNGFGDFSKFGLPGAFAPFYAPVDGCLGDFDLDGDTDVVVAWTDPFTPRTLITLQLNQLVADDGTSTLQFVDARLNQVWTMPVSVSNTTEIRVEPGDFDGDGDLDLVVSRNGTLELFTSTLPARTFVPSTLLALGGAQVIRDLATGDLDANGQLDIAVAVTGGANQILLNAGGMLVASAVPPPPGLNVNGQAVAVDDFNGDGRDDLLLGFAALVSGNLQAFVAPRTATGFGTLIALPGPPAGVTQCAWRDADDDGDLDAVCLTPAQTRLYLQGPSATFVDVSAGTPLARLDAEAKGPTALATGDLDLDLDSDLVVGYDPGLAPFGASFGVFVNHVRQIDLLRTMSVGSTEDIELYSRLQLPAQSGFLGATFAGLFVTTVRPQRTFVPPFGWTSIDSTWAGMPLTALATGFSTTFPLTVPNNPVLVGQSVFIQAVFLRDTTTSPVGDEIRTTNVTETLLQ